jgi:hypothetical protein
MSASVPETEQQNSETKDYAFRVDLDLPETDWDQPWVELLGDELFTFPMEYESRSEFSAPLGDHGLGLFSVWFEERQAAAAYSSMFKEHLHKFA